MTDIAERVTKIIVVHFGLDPSKVVPQAHLVDDLGGDSLDAIELGMAFNEEFGCDISQDELDKIKTVGDAIACVGRYC